MLCIKNMFIMSKRILSYLCIILSIILLLTACSSNFDSSENISKATESSKTESGDESEPLSEVEVEKLRAKIDALYNKNSLNRDGTANNIAVGGEYTVSKNASTEYPDPSLKKLTDGSFAKSTFSGGDKTSWVGYKSVGSTMVIELDLGKLYTNIGDLGISFCKDVGPGIGLPSHVDISIAGDDGIYTYLGTSYTPLSYSSSLITRVQLMLKNVVSARKIKFEIKNTSTTWLFIDELIVNEYTNETPVRQDYYGSFDVPEITEPVFWNSSESDYKKTINLALGRPYQIRSGLELEDAHMTPSMNTTENVGLLTDGKLSPSKAYDNSAWFRFTRGNDREVVIDLGKTSAVKSFSIGFLRDSGTGIVLPNRLHVFLSENGKDWQLVSEIVNLTTPKSSDIIYAQDTLANPIRARYFKAYFTVAPHVWVDEIVVNGTKDVTGAKEVKATVSEDKYPNRYVSPEDIGGTKDIFLSYSSPDVSPITKEVYLPHVGYIENGEMKDTLFDSYLFLPYVKFLYDEGTKRVLSKADWQSYIDNQFKANVNMNALNAAVGEVKDELNKPDYKVSVFLSVFFPVKSQTSFGIVDGRNLNFTNIEDRKAALKWMIDEQVKQFDANKYSNIYLQGFYWFTEEIDYSDPHISELIKFTADYVRSLGYITTWIPYFQASGYTDWQELGFDFACYQPNYAFNHSIPIKRIYDAAEAAKKLGMCIELEVGSASAADVARLKDYYFVGSQTGFMTEAVHMYYQGGVPGVIYAAYQSTDPYIHSLYKDTYLFIKGKFGFEIVNPKDMTIEGKNRASGKIEIPKNDYVLGLSVTESPKYGTVKLKSDGNFEYIPYNNITGKDSFTMIVDYGFAKSDPFTVNVNITN